MMAATVPTSDARPRASRPPFWFVASTAALALTLLMLAVVETDLRAQYFIDEGEFISLFGLGFVGVAGAVLFRRRQLAASLPLVAPWLLYPVISQGDQIIDTLSINPMRVVVHVLLAAIFATPVAVIVAALRLRRRRTALLVAAALLAAEIVLAVLYLGTLMVITLALMIAAVLAAARAPVRGSAAARVLSERAALGLLVAGIAGSAGAYLFYKNLPGAYQGSPSFYTDPARADANYRFDRIAVPAGPVRPPAQADEVRAALAADVHALERLLAGYRILERNYTYDFHNHLFMRERPLLPDYRARGLALVAEARALRTDADAARAAARAGLDDGDPLAALLDEMGVYVAFQFDRAPVLEEMSARFETTRAGLQHAAHLYEGEAKYLGDALARLLRKHARVLEAAPLAPLTREFVARSTALYEAYADHIVGF